MEQARGKFVRLGKWLLLGVGALGVVYAVLSNFRYDYVRMNEGRSVLQFDRWLNLERICRVDVKGSSFYCSRWR